LAVRPRAIAVLEDAGLRLEFVARPAATIACGRTVEKVELRHALADQDLILEAPCMIEGETEAGRLAGSEPAKAAAAAAGREPPRAAPVSKPCRRHRAAPFTCHPQAGGCLLPALRLCAAGREPAAPAERARSFGLAAADALLNPGRQSLARRDGPMRSAWRKLSPHRSSSRSARS
jgi:hypothetical protein